MFGRTFHISYRPGTDVVKLSPTNATIAKGFLPSLILAAMVGGMIFAGSVIRKADEKTKEVNRQNALHEN